MQSIITCRSIGTSLELFRVISRMPYKPPYTIFDLEEAVREKKEDSGDSGKYKDLAEQSFGIAEC